MTVGTLKIVYFSLEEEEEDSQLDHRAIPATLLLVGSPCVGHFQLTDSLLALKWVGSQPHQEPAGR